MRIILNASYDYLFFPRPNPVDTAVSALEFVLRHDDLSSLKPMELNQCWFTRNLLDVYLAFFILLSLFPFFLMILLLKVGKYILNKACQKLETTLISYSCTYNRFLKYINILQTSLLSHRILRARPLFSIGFGRGSFRRALYSFVAELKFTLIPTVRARVRSLKK